MSDMVHLPRGSGGPARREASLSHVGRSVRRCRPRAEAYRAVGRRSVRRKATLRRSGTRRSCSRVPRDTISAAGSASPSGVAFAPGIATPPGMPPTFHGVRASRVGYRRTRRRRERGSLPRMRAMVFRGELESGTPGVLALEERADPVPGAGEILIRVAVCGVCRTDLDLVDGRLAPAHLPVVPGHQIVGRIAALGPGVADSRVGERVGVAWIHSACGVCRWCTSGCENLCPDFVSTGCGHDGGYADLLTVPAGFVHPLPDDLDDLRAAPLLCAGAVGWRALRLTALTDGEPLGLTGFGASAHLVLQLARRRHPRSPIYVFARHPEERRFALELGATWAGPSAERAPRACAAIIDTTPAWTPVVDALGQLAPGDQCHSQDARRSGGAPPSRLRVAPVDGAGDQVRGQRDAAGRPRDVDRGDRPGTSAHGERAPTGARERCARGATPG